MTQVERDRYLEDMLSRPMPAEAERPVDALPTQAQVPDVNEAQSEAGGRVQEMVEGQAVAAIEEGEAESSDRVILREQVLTNPTTGETVVDKQTTIIPSAEKVRSARIARMQRTIYYIARVITIFLVLRFILRLFGANPDNGFSQFIYTLSGPFHYPFRNLFGFEAPITAGTYVFEVSSLFAIGIYWLFAYLGVKGIAVFMRRSPVQEAHETIHV